MQQRERLHGGVVGERTRLCPSSRWAGSRILDSSSRIDQAAVAARRWSVRACAGDAVAETGMPSAAVAEDLDVLGDGVAPAHAGASEPASQVVLVAEAGEFGRGVLGAAVAANPSLRAMAGRASWRCRTSGTPSKHHRDLASPGRTGRGRIQRERSVGPDSPEYEPRPCPRGASFSRYTYSLSRVRHPYVRSPLPEMWRETRGRLGDPVPAWAEITADPERTARNHPLIFERAERWRP